MLDGDMSFVIHVLICSAFCGGLLTGLILLRVERLIERFVG
jgi:hypothetical protein